MDDPHSSKMLSRTHPMGKLQSNTSLARKTQSMSGHQVKKRACYSLQPEAHLWLPVSSKRQEFRCPSKPNARNYRFILTTGLGQQSGDITRPTRPKADTDNT